MTSCAQMHGIGPCEFDGAVVVTAESLAAAMRHNLYKGDYIDNDGAPMEQVIRDAEILYAALVELASDAQEVPKPPTKDAR